MTKLLGIQATVLLVLCASTSFASETEDNDLLTKLAKSTSGFSQNLYQKVAVGKNNVIYSPFSIHSALTMTSDGAKGYTRSEMRTVLGLDSLGESAQSYHDLIVQLNSAARVKLHTANALFIKEGKEIEKAFLDDVTQDYFATVENFDLQAEGGPEKVVNDFVANKTENMIQDVMSPGSIDDATFMLLVNTVFFNGTWQHPFDAFRTRKQDFYQLGGVKKQVDMMKRTGWYRYKRDTTRKADVLELPFKGNRFSLSILLPHDKEGITDLEKTLTGNGLLGDIFQDLQNTNVQINIPKFKIESKLSLASTLVAMGMKKPFIAGVADFTAINKDGNIYLDQVIHQAVIDVKETGTVAAAATVIGIRTMAVVVDPEINFRADHPFIFFLRDSQTDQVLFQGKFSG